MNFASLKFLLLQVRNVDDPMRHNEIKCFSKALDCDPAQIAVFDLLSGVPTPNQIHAVDVVLLGGSGDYSVAEGGAWLPAALESMRELVELSTPTFASCWGFQAMARALGGTVVTDLTRAEVGTIDVTLTEEGRRDPVFQTLGNTFPAQMGHQDIVDVLPASAVRLAFTDRVHNQAFKLRDKPIYCTQFHPELSRHDLEKRVAQYPQYVERVLGISAEQFLRTCCHESRAASGLVRRFVEHVLG